MNKSSIKYQTYVKILKEELVIAGVVAGHADKCLEVLSLVTPKEKLAMKTELERIPIQLQEADTGKIFDIILTLFHDTSYVTVRISDFHTNIVLIEKDGEQLFVSGVTKAGKTDMTDRSLLDVESIVAFVDSVDLEDVRCLLERQIAYNYAIAEEGLKGTYGANIGNVILNTYGNDVKTRAKAVAAAGSDARMSGCGSGSGIAYLLGGDYETVAHTLVNSVAIVSGIICDGAKPSCAAKIAASVDAGILGCYMYLNGKQFYGGDGIVTKGVEATIQNVAQLGKEGMKETDKEIIKIMIGP